MVCRSLRAALVVVGCLSMIACGGSTGESAPASMPPHQAATYEYLVPAGTGARLDRGEAIELMPQTLHATVGQSIFIANEDTRDYDVGPFFVAAGQSLAMTFTHTAVLSGQCSMNPSGEFQIIVSA